MSIFVHDLNPIGTVVNDITEVCKRLVNWYRYCGQYFFTIALKCFMQFLLFVRGKVLLWYCTYFSETTKLWHTVR
jgi:hypothetical protein